jgi:hypothetical protein
MAQTAAHLVERVMPWVGVRQWVVSIPIPLRYWMASSRNLTAQVHRTVRNTIAQYYVNQAVCRGAERHKVQPGSVTFLQRFGSSINLNLHFHIIFLAGVYQSRTNAGLKTRFIKADPPSNADISDVLQKISHRVIRKLRRPGYLEATMDVAVATGYVIRCLIMKRNWRAAWQPRSGSASPLANGRARRYGASGMVLAMKGSGPNSRACAVPR